MGVYGKAIITTAGRNLIAQALAGNESVRFTELKTSDYKYASTASIDALTDIPNVKQTTDITSALVTANSNVKVSAMIRNSGLTAAYYINTIGIYGNTLGFPDTLIAVISAVTGDLVPAYSGSPFSFVFDVNLIIQNASNLNVSVNDAGVATVADLNALWEKAYDVYITNEVSGDVVTFPDGADMIPMKSVSVNFSPLQSLNGYDNPWPAGGGKNLLPPFANSSAGGLTMTVDSEGVCTVNGTRSDSSSVLLGSQSITFSAGSYTLSDGTDNINAMVQIYNATTGVIIWRGGGGTLTFTYNGTDDLRARVWVRGATTYNNVKLYPMIRKSTDSADFAPYSNICPISGWNAANITRIGKNLISFKERLLAWGAIYREIDNNTFVVTALGTGYRSPYQFSETDIDVTLSGTITNLNGGFWQIDLLDSTNTNVGMLTAGTTHISAKASKIRLNYTTLGSGGQIANIQLELGSTFTGYEPYTKATYTNNLPSAFFGGTVDFVSGLVSSEWAEISSYSGETLPGEWLSSYDVYAPGTTPTNGAQVVYKRSTPVVTQVEPKDIYSVYGINTVWSDQNNIDVAYRADTKLYIDAKIAETQALALENS